MNQEFTFHKLNPVGIKKAKLIAAGFDTLLDELLDMFHPAQSGREISLVRTKLEEACFFAKKAMASQPENQE